MSEALPLRDSGEAAPVATVEAVEIASRLAQRLIHDFMSPASGVVSGLDLLDDPAASALRDEAQELIAASARKLVGALSFARAAFAGGVEAFDTRRLATLAEEVFTHLRPGLEWAVEQNELSSPASRVLLNLTQIAGGALATGGLARVTAKSEGGWTAVIVEAIGERVRLHGEVAAGLRGEALGEGLGGRWVQAFYVHALTVSAGGVLAAEVLADRVVFKAALPDPSPPPSPRTDPEGTAS
ncbi:MAG TPA: histidine phosphotransferase family protein [Caulobacteraceae bacterium]